MVENLAPGYLRVTIDRPAPAPGIAPAASGDQWNAPGDQWNGTGDQVRFVTVTGYGNRWDAAAGQLRLVLAEPLR